MTLVPGGGQPLVAQESTALLPEIESLELVGQIGGETYAVAVQGDYAYIGIGPRLVAIDVSDPISPTLVGQTDVMPGIVEDIFIAGEYAYVANADGGLRIVDISVPVDPVVVASVSTGDARGVAVGGDYAYIADHYAFEHVAVVNVSIPTDPVYVTDWPIPSDTDIEDIAVSGDFAYVVDWSGDLWVADISVPNNPTLVGSCSTSAEATEVMVAGDHAYVGTFTAGLRIVDISTPSSPLEVGSWGGGVWGVDVSGSYAYVAIGGMHVLDISTPSNPVEVGSFESLEASSRAVTVVGDYAYLADERDGLRIVDVSVPDDPTEVNSIETIGDHIVGLDASADYAYLVEDHPPRRVQILDMSLPASPAVIGIYDEYRGAKAVDALEPYMYVTDEGGFLAVVDISTPSEPIQIGYEHIQSYAQFKIVVSDDYAYLASGTSFYAIDISTPTSPVEVGFCVVPNSGPTEGIAVSNQHVYMATWTGLKVVDVSDPVSPTQVFSYTSSMIRDVVVSGNYAYVAGGQWGWLYILDVSTPANATEVGSYDPEDSALSVAIDGHYAYVAAGSEGLQVVDVSVPSNPSRVGFYDTPGEAEHVIVENGLIYVTDSKAGLYVLRHEQPTSPKPAIVFVHGWNGLPPGGPCDEWTKEEWVDGYFASVDNYLKDDGGYHVAYAHLETSPCYTPPLVENVTRLRNAITLAKAAADQDKVILIAHSMGGLVSRAYIEGPEYVGDVEALFTFGSPHQGVPLAALAFLANGLSLGEYCKNYQPAACDFSVPGMNLFNRNHPQRADGVIYHAISGDAPFSPRSASAKATYFLLSGGDDGAVQTTSGLGLGGTVDRWTTDETHGTGSGPHSYFCEDDGDESPCDSIPSTSYTQCLEPVLVHKTTDTCGSYTTSGLAPRITSSSTVHTPFVYGTLLPGEADTHIVETDGGGSLFVTQWATGTLEFTLIDPTGQTIDPDYAASHPDIVTYAADENAATYDFPDAIAGSWEMVLEATDAPSGGSSYMSFAAFDSSVVLTAGTDRAWYAPSATATITASLSGSPNSATLTASILYADGVSETLSLSSQGAGQYLGITIVHDAPGYAEVRLTATGATSSGSPFERGSSLAFQVSPDSATLNGIYSDTPLPRSPGSSFYDALSITVGVNTVVSSTFALSANLVDPDDNPVAHSLTYQDIITGANTITLRFDGDDIYASQQNGPYTLTSLLLTDQRGATLVVIDAEDVYTTAAYNYQDFGEGRIYLPLVLRQSQ
jgi:hypothetical protein